MTSKPAVLYHGSPLWLERLEPQAARGVGPDHERLTAIYATDLRTFAIAFALMPPPGSGPLQWEVHLPDAPQEPPRIVCYAGHPRRGAIGYVYVLPSTTFSSLPEHQWASSVSVVPLAYDVIHVEDYLSWIAYAGPEGMT